MKYKIQTHPNPNCVTVHLRTTHRLINGASARFDDPFSQLILYGEDGPVTKPQPGVIAGLWKIGGIVGLNLDAYSISIHKSEAFDWTDILPATIAAINLSICPDEEMQFQKSDNHAADAKPLEQTVIDKL